MSSSLPTPRTEHESLSGSEPKPQRVLACVLCQQRKIKCDRESPCGNCMRAHARCIPGALVQRRRKRRFAERDLLERLRHYEGLLRKHHIDFEPLHPPEPVEERTKNDTGTPASPVSTAATEAAPLPSETGGDGFSFMANCIWDAMNHKAAKILLPGEDDPDEDMDDASLTISKSRVRKAVEHLHLDNDDIMLFGGRIPDVQLSSLHPGHHLIFKLWQLYLNNVDPLLKVTHAPSLQARIIDAVGNLSGIDSTMHALMFSVYCMAIQSLSQTECRNLFGSTKESILKSYHFACQQALLECGVLRTSERDCLTALYLYLLSFRPDGNPRSLSLLLGMAIRLAQRMRLHDETSNCKHGAFEAEMRRRLWWSMIVFDNRICEQSDLRCAMIAPTWDCRVPLNVNDSELRPDMKMTFSIRNSPSEAIFAVVRSESADHVRRSAFHLESTNPYFKAIVGKTSCDASEMAQELETLDKLIEGKYLRLCDTENPLQYMTAWTIRGYVAKNRLMQHITTFATSDKQPSEQQRDAATSYAISTLECDTKLIVSPLTQGYLWMTHLHFPFPGYCHLVQDVRRRPLQPQVKRIFDAMSENYENRCQVLMDEYLVPREANPMFKIFDLIVLHAWTAHEAACRDIGLPKPEPSKMIVDILARQQRDDDCDQSNSTHPGLTEHSTTQFVSQTQPDVSQHFSMTDFDLDSLGWSTMDWNNMQGFVW